MYDFVSFIFRKKQKKMRPTLQRLDERVLCRRRAGVLPRHQDVRWPTVRRVRLPAAGGRAHARLAHAGARVAQWRAVRVRRAGGARFETARRLQCHGTEVAHDSPTSIACCYPRLDGDLCNELVNVTEPRLKMTPGKCVRRKLKI